MNNLLRTLTESQVKSAYPDSDLKLLLNTVKEGRRQSYDTKLSDAFYDSLEGLLVDLKTVTIDNHDAEPFLKPVAKAEAPDYYEVIGNPMDFGTMMKKVKSKQYKGKREFIDDLELIWGNCYTYNAAENHPLRQCVKRLKVKADKLLKHITDRRDRADPPIPSDLVVTHVARPKVNGYNSVNGRAHSHHRTPSYPSSSSKSGTPAIRISTALRHPARSNVQFPDSSAIPRTREGMALFMKLDRDIMQASTSGSSTDTQQALEKLQDLALSADDSSEPESDNIHTPDSGMGDKRKANGFVDRRPRKRARFTSHTAIPATYDRNEISELWWSAMHSDALLGNGLPQIPFFASSSSSSRRQQHTHPPDAIPRVKPKRRKKLSEDQPKTLLKAMNTNVKTMRRLRHTHARFAALNLTTSNAEDPDGAAGGMDGTAFGATARGSSPAVAINVEDDAIGVVDDKVDEHPWSVPRKGKRRIGGIELGERHAQNCVTWMNRKVLEHAGFQGTSQVALEVLAGVTSEYLFNVGRTIKFLCDKYATTMTAEEIILHTLFESGTSKVQDLERYISDDIERYGGRLLELEKKLVNAYRETTAAEVLEDEGLFEEEDEEDAGVLAIGDFADVLGEDYLGLRELGIAAEFGMTSLSIPKKLLKRKKLQNKPTAAKPAEPPPPYPPPPPLIPLSSADLDDQIELLKPYYQSRFAALAPPPLPSPPVVHVVDAMNANIHPGYVPPLQTYGGPLYPPINGIGDLNVPGFPPTGPPQPPCSSTPIILPDDSPNPVQVKMGPLGQIIKVAPTTTGTKKKKPTVMPAPPPGAAVGGPAGGGGGMGTDVSSSPKKKKVAVAVHGKGIGKKKVGDGAGETPPAVLALLPGVITAAPVQVLPAIAQ